MQVGVTSNLERRIDEYKNKLVEGLSQKYNVKKLVCDETTNHIIAALERKKQIWAVPSCRSPGAAQNWNARRSRP